MFHVAEESRKSLVFSTMSKVGSVNKTKSSLITSLKNLGRNHQNIDIIT